MKVRHFRSHPVGIAAMRINELGREWFADEALKGVGMGFLVDQGGRVLENTMAYCFEFSGYFQVL